MTETPQKHSIGPADFKTEEATDLKEHVIRCCDEWLRIQRLAEKGELTIDLTGFKVEDCVDFTEVWGKEASRE